MVTKSYEGIFMSINSPQINPNTAYYSPAADKKIKAGGTILGGLLGMTAYYIPVTRDESKYCLTSSSAETSGHPDTTLTPFCSKIPIGLAPPGHNVQARTP